MAVMHDDVDVHTATRIDGALKGNTATGRVDGLDASALGTALDW